VALTDFGTDWQNWIRDYQVTAQRYTPANKDALIELVKSALEKKGRVRAVGSGHSMSKCARPHAGETYINLAEISGAFDEVKWLKRDPPDLAKGEQLIRVKAGTRLKTLNRIILPKRRLALINMGTFDGQTIAGAISAGTHGAGTRLGSLADMVVSMDIVTATRQDDGQPHVQMRRIEPINGVTDRDVFNKDRAEHGMTLEQNDNTFYSMVLSYGCMGIAYAYTLKVRSAYWLQEEDELVQWRSLRDDLEKTTSVPNVGTVPTKADDDRHFLFLLNVAETQGKKATDNPACLVTRRNIVPAADEPKIHAYSWPPERAKDSFFEWFAGFFKLNTPDPAKDHDGLGQTLREHYFERHARIEPFKGNRTSSASFIAHRRERDASDPEKAPEPPPETISLEVAVPAERVTDVLETVTDHIRRSNIFFATPISVRFTAPSKHFLSPAYDRATVFIEVAMVLSSTRPNGKKLDRYQMRDRVAKPALDEIENRLCFEGERLGRPHLGKYNNLDRKLLMNMFPKAGTWLDTYRRFNSFGTFDNAFTDQLGLTGED
jgi:FAD/FMN-containing dehydrogenase